MLTKRQEFPINSEGGRVVTLNGEDKEVLCMIQAFYSRSPNPVEFHLDKVAKLGTAGFMSKWYIGYGHDSIGDSATDTLFIEGIADNEAEDFQRHPLMRLQRASTRMMDFSKVPFILPKSCGDIHRKYVETLRDFYLKAGPILEDYLLQKNQIDLESMTPPQKREMMSNISAAKFDILRGFLPAGVAVSLSCTLSLRAFKDHLTQLRNALNPRIQKIADVVWQALREKHPSSFPDPPRQTPEQATWQKQYDLFLNGLSFEFTKSLQFENIQIQKIGSSEYQKSVSKMFPKEKGWQPSKEIYNQIYVLDKVDRFAIPQEMRELLATRPERVLVPKDFNMYGQFRFEFAIDQGSARDLQRHNSIQKKSGRLNDELGFESWYLDQLPEELRDLAKEIIQIPEELTCNLDVCDCEYFMPMGYRIPFQFTGGLADLIYLLEIRCAETVHPTLRKHLCEIAIFFQQEYPEIKLYANTEPSRFSFERGKQTIQEKSVVSTN